MKSSVLVALLCALLCSPALAESERQIIAVSYPSAALTKFWQTPISVEANVLLPDSYYKDPGRRYPAIYVIPAFGGSFALDPATERKWQAPMRALGAEFIVVLLEGMISVNGEMIHQEYADSVNDGPWGTALTIDVIPAIDAQFRTAAASRSRFLFGHSSGGWSALWLQVNSPDMFGGAWALSPDPVDFHDFTGPDLTRTPPQNFYQDDAGRAYGFDRAGNRDRSTLRAYVHEYAWMRRQIDSFNTVFSPRGVDGKPAQLFDFKTGAIDGSVAAYWEAHYDITHLLEQRWSVIGPSIDGKIHVYVGDADTFHLDGSVRLLDEALKQLGARAEIQFAPGANHANIYAWHDDMIRYAMSEMNASVTSAPSGAR
jgi:S-formylglutathione hydrolase FrmB